MVLVWLARCAHSRTAIVLGMSIGTSVRSALEQEAELWPLQMQRSKSAQRCTAVVFVISASNDPSISFFIIQGDARHLAELEFSMTWRGVCCCAEPEDAIAGELVDEDSEVIL